MPALLPFIKIDAEVRLQDVLCEPGSYANSVGRQILYLGYLFYGTLAESLNRVTQFLSQSCIVVLFLMHWQICFIM